MAITMNFQRNGVNIVACVQAGDSVDQAIADMNALYEATVKLAPPQEPEQVS